MYPETAETAPSSASKETGEPPVKEQSPTEQQSQPSQAANDTSVQSAPSTKVGRSGTARRLSSFASQLETELDKGGIGSIYSNQAVGNVFEAAEMPKAEVVGTEEKLREIKELNILEQGAIEAPPELFNLGLLDFQLTPYKDNKGKQLTNKNGEKIYIMRAKWGYRFYNNKPNYRMNIYSAAKNLWQHSVNLRMHLGNFKRNLINPEISGADVSVRFLSPYRIDGGYRYHYPGSPYADDTRSRSLISRVFSAPYELLKGVIVGPRVAVSTGPITETKAKSLIAILSQTDAKARLEAEENA